MEQSTGIYQIRNHKRLVSSGKIRPDESPRVFLSFHFNFPEIYESILHHYRFLREPFPARPFNPLDELGPVLGIEAISKRVMVLNLIIFHRDVNFEKIGSTIQPFLFLTND